MIRLLTLDDLEPWVALSLAHHGESGNDGDEYFGPYPKSEPYPVDEVRERNRGRWQKPLSLPGWRRAWGVFVDDELVGCGDLAGGDLTAQLHRSFLGMGILRPHRGRGHGRALLEEIVRWARAEPRIAWIDLGVIGDNEHAVALYRKLGFVHVGVREDAFRMDGHSRQDRQMSLSVE